MAGKIVKGVHEGGRKGGSGGGPLGLAQKERDSVYCIPLYRGEKGERKGNVLIERSECA